MILNSYFSFRFSESRDDKLKKRERLEKDIDSTQEFYERVLHSSDKLIRNSGRAETNELEEFYKLEIRLKLIGSKEVLNKFSEVKSGIADFAHKLPEMPEEFVPQFENDTNRQYRLETRKKAKQKRENEAEKYRPDLYKKHSGLSDLMKQHLQDMRNLI